MAASKKIRLDELVVEQGLTDTRNQAKALILAGKVLCGTERMDKPGRSVSKDMGLTVQQPPRFVSRGGEKLEGFLDKFCIDVRGVHLLDVGASTGGFTDCCLQRGASQSTCVDVGRAQLHNKLIQDARVTNIEKTNARHLTSGSLPFDSYPLIVMDLSFISLTKVLPAVWNFCAMGGYLIALIKPQFEAQKSEVDAGKGIIRDKTVHERVVQEIQSFASNELTGAQLIGTMVSPIKGTDGNVEFLIGLQRQN